MKFLKILGITFFSVLVVMYLAFLFVLPNAINLNSFMPEINKIAKDMVGLNIDVKNIQLKTYWNMQAKIALNDVSVKYPSESELLAAQYGEAGVKLLPLLLLKL